MKSFVVLLLTFVVSVANATLILNFDTFSFQIQSFGALEKIEAASLYPEASLERFYPIGAIISHKKIDKNQFEFYATKTVLFLTKTIFVHAAFDFFKGATCRLDNEIGYHLSLDFSGSDGFFYDNIESFNGLICFHELSPNKLEVRVEAKMRKGKFYNAIVGKIISDLILEQIRPLVLSITSQN